MPRVCSALNCSNRDSKYNGLSFYRFPLQNKPRLQLWLKAVRRGNFEPTIHHYICSEHFTADCYLSNYVNMRKLKDNAVPTKFDLPPHLEKDVGLFDKWKRKIPRANKALSEDDDVEKIYETKLSDGAQVKLEMEKPALQSSDLPVNFPNSPTYLSKAQLERKPLASRNPLPKKCQDQSEGIVIEPLYQNTTGMSTEKSSKSDKELDFNSLSSGSIELPSNLWSITSTTDFVIYAKWNKQYTCESRIVIERDLTVKVYIQNRATNTADMIKLTCLQDVSSLLLKIDNLLPVLELMSGP